MNPTVQLAVSAALKSLEEPLPLHVTPAGSQQFERQGAGDVQTLVISKRREVKSGKLDGNISGDSFDKLW